MNAGLTAHRFVMRIALAGAGTFAWIFAFEYYSGLYQSIPAAVIQTAFLYLVAQISTALATPIAAQMVRNGVKRSMVYAVLFAAAAFVVLGSEFSGGADLEIKYGLLAFAVFLGLYRAFYWTPYAIEKNATTRTNDFVSLAEDFMVAGMPLLFSLSLEEGPGADVWLLFVSGGLILISLVPLAIMPERFDKFTWGYRETFGHLVEPRYQRLVWTSLMDGAQSATLYFLWPIVVFILVGFSYTTLGAIVSLALMLAIPARLFARSFARTWKFETPVVPMAVSGSVWLMRLFVATPAGLIFVDAFSAAAPSRTVSVAPIHEHAADGGSYIDELSALKELGLALGRILMVTVVCSLTLVFTLIQALAITFIAIALFAMASVWLQNSREPV